MTANFSLSSSLSRPAISSIFFWRGVSLESYLRPSALASVPSGFGGEPTWWSRTTKFLKASGFGAATTPLPSVIGNPQGISAPVPRPEARPRRVVERPRDLEALVGLEGAERALG